MPFPRELTVERLRLSAGVRAPNTLQAYASDWKRYCRWCTEHECAPLPASAENVGCYLTDALNDGRKITTVTRYNTSIGFYHRAAGHTVPWSAEVRTLLIGAQRVLKEQPAHREPVSIEQIREIRAQPCSGWPITGVRNGALLLIGFTSALRRSNLAALDMADLEFTPRGLVVTVRHEKQDQTGIGRILGIPLGRHQETCAIHALQLWLTLRGVEPGPVFQRIRNGKLIGRMHPNRISLVVKKQVAKIGLDPSVFGAHSMRSGFVTAAVEANVNELVIMAQTGHRSLQSLRRYYRSRDPFKANAVAALDL